MKCVVVVLIILHIYYDVRQAHILMHSLRVGVSNSYLTTSPPIFQVKLCVGYEMYMGLLASSSITSACFLTYPSAGKLSWGYSTIWRHRYTHHWHSFVKLSLPAQKLCIYNQNCWFWPLGPLLPFLKGPPNSSKTNIFKNKHNAELRKTPPATKVSCHKCSYASPPPKKIW